MKLQELQKNWWACLPAIVIAVAIGVHRDWDGFSLVLLAGIVLVSCLRFILPLFRGSVARKMAKMSPGAREQLLSRCTPEERRKLEKEIHDHAG